MSDDQTMKHRLASPSLGLVRRSLVMKRSLVIAGHKTAVSLEEPFWTGANEDRRSPADPGAHPDRTDRSNSGPGQPLFGDQAVRSGAFQAKVTGRSHPVIEAPRTRWADPPARLAIIVTAKR